jgi:hypothetical protein
VFIHVNLLIFSLLAIFVIFKRETEKGLGGSFWNLHGVCGVFVPVLRAGVDASRGVSARLAAQTKCVRRVTPQSQNPQIFATFA